MITMKAVVQKRRKDAFWPVYIRVTKDGVTAFIKTEKMVHDSGLNGRREIVDNYLLKTLNERIVEYNNLLNRYDTKFWSVKQIVELLRNDDDLNFSDYARKHVERLINNGQERTARNYERSIRSLELFAGTNKIMFAQMTSQFLNEWIKSMERTHRAKEMYPICIRQIYKEAIKEYNDEEFGIMRIKSNPWTKVSIPKADKTEKLAITMEACREFFSAPLPASKFISPLPELGRDVAKMVLCLGGINTVDLYNLKKSDYFNGIIHYCRAKTKKFRRDEAYMEMRVPQILYSLFSKYQSAPNDEYLFCFHERYSSSDSFGANVNIGIRKICMSMGMAKEDSYCVYTFRHTWGTVAQNECDASIAEVAFGMNHSSGHTVTRGYLKLNYSPAWILNEKVVELIFFTDRKSRVAGADDQPAPVGLSRFSAKHMMRGTIYFRGAVLGSITDTGFDNVDQIIRKLCQFIPQFIPAGSTLQFRIENLDKSEIGIYEHTKGKAV